MSAGRASTRCPTWVSRGPSAPGPGTDETLPDLPRPRCPEARPGRRAAQQPRPLLRTLRAVAADPVPHRGAQRPGAGAEDRRVGTAEASAPAGLRLIGTVDPRGRLMYPQAHGRRHGAP